MKKITIAIDGPAGSGKTTTAKLVAEKLRYIYIDTGAMYRAVTLVWLETGKPLDEEFVGRLVDRIELDIKNTSDGQKTYLSGKDVSDEIRTAEVTKYVSPISAMGRVRERLVEMQRELGRGGGAVLDGRDIGTNVFPNAELKIFLVASPEARAERRANEMREKGFEVSEEEILKAILDRDKYDSTREINPLSKAEDAIEIDTSDLTIEEQTQIVYETALSIIEE